MATSGNKNWYQEMLEAVKAVTTPAPQSRDEVVAWYAKKYPGEVITRKGGKPVAAWIDKLVSDLQTETGLSRPSLLRRFQARGERNWQDIQPSPAAKLQYKALGDKIGPRAPKNGYLVDFKGWLLFSNTCEKREFTVTITGKWSQQIAEVNARIMPAFLLIYMEEDNQRQPIDDQQPSIGICIEDQQEGVQNPTITVTANKRRVAQGHSGRKRRFSFFAK